MKVFSMSNCTLSFLSASPSVLTVSDHSFHMKNLALCFFAVAFNMRNALREIPKLNSHFSLQLENYAFKLKSGLYQLNLENIIMVLQIKSIFWDIYICADVNSKLMRIHTKYEFFEFTFSL